MKLQYGDRVLITRNDETLDLQPTDELITSTPTVALDLLSSRETATVLVSDLPFVLWLWENRHNRDMFGYAGTEVGKMYIIYQLLNGISQEIWNTADKIPERWSGHEIRQWVSDMFAECSGACLNDGGDRQTREYRNDRIMLDI